jgi:hypothetical protein
VSSKLTGSAGDSTVPERARAPHLSKSRYLSGLQCERRLWLGWHDPERPAPSAPGSIFAVGHEVGLLAHQLFPGGVLVGGGPAEFHQAVAETRALLSEGSVAAIFEAAFAFDNVWVRADVLERRSEGRWALHEVKSSTRLKPENLHDMMVQTYVIEGCGLILEQIGLIHINTAYVRDAGPSDPRGLFSCADATARVREGLPDVAARVARMQSILNEDSAPVRRPSAHCFQPYECEFWSRCTDAKPDDWIWYLPRLRGDQFAALEAAGVESIRDIPAEFALVTQQRRAAAAWRKGDYVVQPGLRGALQAYEACAYLDFETFNPAIPLYPGGRPYERQPAQWSLHRRDGGVLTHTEFLAKLSTDPAREFTESLLSATSFEGPVFVYSPFERSVLSDLTRRVPEHREAISALQARLIDLLPVVRTYVDHPQFYGSNSIKAVAPVFSPEIDYGALNKVAGGEDASAALYRLATGVFQPDETEETLRSALLRYCGLDTLALAHVHAVLIALDKAPAADDQADGKIGNNGS